MAKNMKNGNMTEVNKKTRRGFMMEIIGKGIKRKNKNPPVRMGTRKETRKIRKRNMINVNQKVMKRTMRKMIGKGIKRKNENPQGRKKIRKMNGNVWNVKRNVIHWKQY